MASTTWPAMTMREARKAWRDKDEGRHWHGDRCWCGEEHEAGTAGLVPPPWAQDRNETTGAGK